MITLLAESYGRAYGSCIMAQQLSELEEIVDYKRLLKQTFLAKPSNEPEETEPIEPTGSLTSSLHRMRNQGLSFFYK